MAVEKTLLIVKPDAVERNLIGHVIGRLEKARFVIRNIKMVRLDKTEARRFYAVHEGKPFLDRHCSHAREKCALIQLTRGLLLMMTASHISILGSRHAMSISSMMI